MCFSMPALAAVAAIRFAASDEIFGGGARVVAGGGVEGGCVAALFALSLSSSSSSSDVMLNSSEPALDDTSEEISRGFPPGALKCINGLTGSSSLPCSGTGGWWSCFPCAETAGGVDVSGGVGGCESSPIVKSVPASDPGDDTLSAAFFASRFCAMGPPLPPSGIDDESCNRIEALVNVIPGGLGLSDEAAAGAGGDTTTAAVVLFRCSSMASVVARSGVRAVNSDMELLFSADWLLLDSAGELVAVGDRLCGRWLLGRNIGMGTAANAEDGDTGREPSASTGLSIGRGRAAFVCCRGVSKSKSPEVSLSIWIGLRTVC